MQQEKIENLHSALFFCDSSRRFSIDSRAARRGIFIRHWKPSFFADSDASFCSFKNRKWNAWCVQNLGRIRVDDKKLWSNEVFIGFLKGFIQFIDIFNEKGPLQNVRWHGTFNSIKGPLIHISSIFHLYFSHIRIQNQVQKSSPYKSTFRRSRVTLYNHEMGVKFENFDLFEHTSAFKMIIFLRVWGKAACFACFEGLNISVYDISFTIHSYFN